MTNYECNGLKYKTNSTKSVKHCPGCGSSIDCKYYTAYFMCFKFNIHIKR